MIKGAKLAILFPNLKNVPEYNMKKFDELIGQIKGDGYHDSLHRNLYATDASIYRELPMGVVLPKDKSDCQKIVRWAVKNKVSLIPRAAGTSLAGQCVGDGLIVDTSRYMTSILELNAEEGWVRVEPGVIRDELNNYLAPYGWYFGPNTSTANRCMIGGMVGNNSCGSTSIEFGNTRDHIRSLEVLLSNGDFAFFRDEDPDKFFNKDKTHLRYTIGRKMVELLNREGMEEKIRESYPHPEIHRRNQGYALDILRKASYFDGAADHPFNLSTLLCGSEGTLALTTEIVLNLVPLPGKDVAVLCPHFHTINEAMKATVLAMSDSPSKCELMDRTILHCAWENPDQLKNKFCIEGDPGAVLMIEFRGDEESTARYKAERLREKLKSHQMGYVSTLVEGKDTDRVWNLRAAGLGVLSNMKGDAKPLACIEDTAVRLVDLPDYIAEFETICAEHNQAAIFYAHAGAGELHLRPILNLKTAEGVKGLRDISTASARLVKKYKGVLSGEHGDGRVRAEFLPMMVGEEMYDIWRQVKAIWDPHNLFNPGKIVDAPPMDTALRYSIGEPDWSYDTYYKFENGGGMMSVVEKCNGTGECRKLAETGDTMCPSYMATRYEEDSTRARANAMREYMKGDQNVLTFDSPEVMKVLDHCLSCKGCKNECPSNVDMTKLKSEYYAQYYKNRRRSIRDYMILRFYDLYRMAAGIPGISNFVIRNFGTLIKKTASFHTKRSLPPVSAPTWKKWMKNHTSASPVTQEKKVYIFIDEFIDVNEAEIGIKAVELLEYLGYEVEYLEHKESGRAAFSKGFLEQGRKIARHNVEVFSAILTEPNAVILGVEPSAILSFRDEYPEILRGKEREQALQLATRAWTVEEFLSDEIRTNQISSASFDGTERTMAVHLHCHFKAMSEKESVVTLLSLPENHHVEYIPSGCCGMAGSFGFETEHFELSMKVGELVVFPAMRSLNQDAIPVAQGVSCRHQILDGVGKRALHPVEVLHEAVIKNYSRIPVDPVV